MSIDDVLAAWAAGMRLPDAAAAEIYQRIVATPTPAGTASRGTPGLDRRWWRDFTADFTTQMIRSTRPAGWAA